MQDPFNLGALSSMGEQCGEGGQSAPTPPVLVPGALASHQERVPREPGEHGRAPGGQVWPVSEGLLTIPPLSSCCFFPDVLILEAVTLLGLVASWNLEPLPADNIPVAAGIPQALAQTPEEKSSRHPKNPPPPRGITSVSLQAPGATGPSGA